MSGACDMEFYAIRLLPEQSVLLYGLMSPKTTLTWRDVLENARIHFAACIQHGVPAFKLHKLQPDIKEWIRCGKATVADCEHMEPWCVCVCVCAPSLFCFLPTHCVFAGAPIRLRIWDATLAT